MVRFSLNIKTCCLYVICESKIKFGQKFFASPKVCTPVHLSQKYGGISESHASKDCVKPIILDAELYKTCPGERVLVVMTHQVQCNIPTFEALLQ